MHGMKEPEYFITNISVLLKVKDGRAGKRSLP